MVVKAAVVGIVSSGFIVSKRCWPTSWAKTVKFDELAKVCSRFAGPKVPGKRV